LYPNVSQKEEADVQQIMKAIEKVFSEYYSEFYNMKGPKWIE